jgi:hypothetical protein
MAANVGALLEGIDPHCIKLTPDADAPVFP